MPNNKIQLNGKYFYAIGKRKTAISKVRLYKGSGKLYVNFKEITKNKPEYIKPLTLTNNQSSFDISTTISGGGISSWIDATNLGIARALLEYDKEYRQLLKKHGYLKRDPRKKERKKPGLKKARRAPQWQKR